MTPSKTCLVNGKTIERLYRCGKHVVYIDNRLSEMDLEEAVRVNRLEAEKRQFEQAEDTTHLATL